MHTKALNMQTWYGMVIVVGRGDGTLIELETPRCIAFLFSTLKSIQDFAIVGERNSDGILHLHCLVKTLVRSDSLQRSLRDRWMMARVTGMEDIEDPDPTLEICKCQKAHRPGALMAYMVKDPLWVCAFQEKTLQYVTSMWYHNQGQKYLEKEEEKNRRKQTLPQEVLQGGHAVTRDVLNIIYKYNCLSAEDIFKYQPEVVVQHLHKPGFINIIKNCLQFVESTRGDWSMAKNSEKFPPNPAAIHKCFLHQGLDVEETDYIFYMWITQIHTKKNTIVLQGPSNTGKSAFIRGLKGVMSCGEIVNGQVFQFEGLVNKKLGVWEEPLISAEAAEKTKQVLEGMPTAIPVKYKKPHQLPRIPIIITTNHNLWRYCNAEELAFRNRCWILSWEHPSDPPTFYPRSSCSSCQCSSCQRSSSSQVATDLRTVSSLPGSHQPIQPVGRGDQSGRELGSGCTGPLPATMDRGDSSSSGATGSGAGDGRGDYGRSTSSTGRPEELGTDQSGPSSSAGSSISYLRGSSGYHGSSNPDLGIYGAGGGDGMSMVSFNIGGGDGSTSDGVRYAECTDVSTSTTDLRSDRVQYAGIFEMVELDARQTDRNQVETQESGMGGSMDTLNVPTCYDWCCYFCFLYKCYK